MSKVTGGTVVGDEVGTRLAETAQGPASAGVGRFPPSPTASMHRAFLLGALVGGIFVLAAAQASRGALDRRAAAEGIEAFEAAIADAAGELAPELQPVIALMLVRATRQVAPEHLPGSVFLPPSRR